MKFSVKNLSCCYVQKLQCGMAGNGCRGFDCCLCLIPRGAPSPPTPPMPKPPTPVSCKKILKKTNKVGIVMVIWLSEI